MGVRSYVMEWIPFAAMVIVECLDVGLATISKAAMSRGMSHFVFVAYSNALATLILFPSYFFINNNRTARPPLSFSLLCKFFFLGLVGITVMQNCVFTGISYSSPTLGSAMSNLTPAITFVLAVIFRQQLGYPSQLTIVAFYCLFGTIQCTTLTLVVVRDQDAWKLRPDIELVSIFYSAIFGSVVTFSVLTWCIDKKGPVFVTMFKPVGIAIAAFTSVVFLGDTLHVGSIIGALVIVVGLYTVLWAQSNEGTGKGLNVDRQSSLPAQASPLLESP